MILAHEETTDLGHWGLGRTKLLLNFGHNEYSLPQGFDRIEVREATALDWESLEQNDPWSAEADKEWAEAYVVSGPVLWIAKAFYLLSVELDPHMDPANYTPGGDDDTFDYWPSGMRLLYALACDLDKLIPEKLRHNSGGLLNPGGTRYRDRYTAVLRNAQLREVPELEGSVPLA